MEVYVEYIQGVQFEIKARQHSLLSEQPVENGGKGGGVTPPELLLAALGSCAAYYAVLHLRKWGLPVGGTRVSVSASKAVQPARLNDFLIRVESGVSLTQDRQHGMRQAVEHCLIHNTLLHAPTIRIDIHP